jgi:hypothetical protein
LLRAIVEWQTAAIRGVVDLLNCLQMSSSSRR